MQAVESDNGLSLGQHTLLLIVSIALSILIHFGVMHYFGDRIVATVVQQSQRELQVQPELTPIQIERFVEEMELVSMEVEATPDATADAELVQESISAEAEVAQVVAPVMPNAPELPEITPMEELPEVEPKLPALPLNPVRQEVAAVPVEVFTPPVSNEPLFVIEKDIPRENHTLDFSLPTVAYTRSAGMPVFGSVASSASVATIDEVIESSRANAAAATEETAKAIEEDVLAHLEEARDLEQTETLIAEAVKSVQPDVIDVAQPVVRIDDRLNVSIKLYQTPLDYAHNYFELTITRRPESLMPTMEKDVIFIQDVSGSIGKKRLKQINEATKSAFFNVLRIGDRYRVLAFRHEVLTTDEDWSVVTSDTFKREQAFIDSFRAKGATNLYLLLRSLLTIPRDPRRPVIAVIVTDGEPTAGVLETTRIITDFSRANAGNISVYTFDAKKSNPYFLDMLCYTNRGENTSASSAQNIENLARELKPVFESIRNPVMMNPFLTFDTDSGGNVHPRRLTNLYADRPLTVYGKVKRTAKTITCQLHGIASENNYDAVFTFNVDEIERTNTNYRHAWAERALFDLLAEYARNPSESLKTQIDNFSRNYGLPNPYAK